MMTTRILIPIPTRILTRILTPTPSPATRMMIVCTATTVTTA